MYDEEDVVCCVVGNDSNCCAVRYVSQMETPFPRKGSRAYENAEAEIKDEQKYMKVIEAFLDQEQIKSGWRRFLNTLGFRKAYAFKGEGKGTVISMRWINPKNRIAKARLRGRK